MLNKSIKAVIFDMDGVISDTQTIHAKAESELLTEYGIIMHPDEITKKYAGVSNREMFAEIFDNAGRNMPELKQLVDKKWKMMNERLKGNVKEINGTRNFIELCKNQGLPLAIGSASSPVFIEFILNELGLKNKFNAITSAHEVKKGKPEPDLFLLAAKKLSIAPENCLVIEDGVSGMVAAKRAGMQCIGLVADKNDKNYPADLLVNNLKEVPIKEYLFLTQ